MIAHHIRKHQHFNGRIWKQLFKVLQTAWYADWPFAKYMQHWKSPGPVKRYVAY